MNLTDTAILVKRIAIIGVLFFFSFFFFRFSLTILKAIYLQINPPPPPPVTTIFGKLPALAVPKLPIENGENMTYTIDTPTGKFPALPAKTKVYRIEIPSATLLSESRARALAKSLGFSNEPTRVSSSELHWDDVPTSRSFDINIVTGNFNLKTDYAKLALDLTPGSTPTQAQAINTSLTFLTNKQLLSKDYLEGSQTTALIKTASGNPVEAGSLSDAQITRINFWRQIDKVNITGPNPKEGLIQMDIASSEGVAGIPAINYNSWLLNTEKVGEYPLKAVDKAYMELKSGQGGFTYLKLRGQDYFASYQPLNLSTASVRQVELAYYDTLMPQSFLQPIFVFSGIFKTTGGSEGEFVAYVPAVDQNWVESAR